MPITIIPEKWLGQRKDFGILILRLFIGIRLVYGVVDNVFSWKHMQEFEQFLGAHHFPVPLASAILSVYAQLICGIMLIAGFHTRLAATIMIVNFIVALITVHRSDSFEGMTPAMAILFSCVFFLFYGPGRIALRKEH